jgi:hypothetical protein
MNGSLPTGELPQFYLENNREMSAFTGRLDLVSSMLLRPLHIAGSAAQPASTLNRLVESHREFADAAFWEA